MSRDDESNSCGTSKGEPTGQGRPTDRRVVGYGTCPRDSSPRMPAGYPGRSPAPACGGDVSKLGKVVASQVSMSPATSIAASLRSAHSHTRATRQPEASSSARFLRSRRTLPSNLSSQKRVRVAGITAYLHPACLCQKQPLTKQTALNRRNTKSGLPGRCRLCRPYRIPRRCSAWRNANSGLVSCPLTRAMILERVVSSTTSTMPGVPPSRRFRALASAFGSHWRTAPALLGTAPMLHYIPFCKTLRASRPGFLGGNSCRSPSRPQPRNVSWSVGPA